MKWHRFLSTLVLAIAITAPLQQATAMSLTTLRSFLGPERPNLSTGRIANAYLYYERLDDDTASISASVQVLGAKPQDLSVTVPLVLGMAVRGEAPVPEFLALPSAQAWGGFGSQGVHIHRLPALITAAKRFLSRFASGPDDCSDFSQCLDYIESQLFAGHAGRTLRKHYGRNSHLRHRRIRPHIGDQVAILPEPSTALLMGLGLIGLRVCGRRRPSC
jgi:hypothetical protein